MTRVTLIAFALLSGFFYVTGKPVDENGQQVNRFADFGKHKFIAAHALDRTSPKKLTSRDKYSSLYLRSDRQDKAATRNEYASIRDPALPSRNPRRVANSSFKYAKLPPALPIETPIKLVQLAKTETSQTFSEGRNKFTRGTTKPLGQSYQQRYVKSQKPVLGPRLTAVLVKRELRRIGCYSGNVTSNWDDNARAAITFYNTSTGSSLTTKTPLVSSLEHLQQVTKTVCVETPTINETSLASAGKRKANTRTRAFKRVSKWRTKARSRKAAFRPTSTTRTPQYEIKRPRLVENYIAPPSMKRRKIKRMRRARYLKKKRIAKRKARRRTAVRSWRKRYRRKRFGFSNNGGNFTLNN
ncbi:MAG: hypothetical protein GY927_06335 [bacterium]|nr:hypothetical protein [bacterium]